MMRFVHASMKCPFSLRADEQLSRNRVGVLVSGGDFVFVCHCKRSLT
jgi:hypothetical protein